jgi:WD40 repeat protein
MEMSFRPKGTFDLRKDEEHAGGNVSVAFGADGRSLFYGFNHDVGRIDLGEKPSKKSAHLGHSTTTHKCSESESIASVKTARSGRFLLVKTSGVIWWADDGKYFGDVLLVDADTHEIARKIDHYESLTAFPEPRIICTAMSPDAKRVAVGWEKGKIRIFETGKEAPPLEVRAGEGDVYTLVFGPEGETLLVGLEGGAVDLWKISSRQPLKSPIRMGSGGPEKDGENACPAAVTAAFSLDGRFAATGRSDGVLQLWRMAPAGEPFSAVAHHPGRICCMAFSPCGKWLLSAGNRGNARIWSTEGLGYSGEVDSPREGTLSSMSFSPDGKLLALGLEQGECCLFSVYET